MNYVKDWAKLAKAGGVCGILLFIRPVLNLLFSRGRSWNEHASIDFSAFIFILYAFVCFTVACKTITKSNSYFSKQLMVSTPLIWFIIYTIYGVISLFWSVNFALTGFRAFECMSMILLFVAIMQKLFTTCYTERIIDWIILYITIDIVFAILNTLKWTTSFEMLLHSSQMVSTVFFFMALYYPNKKWYHYLIMIMAVFSGSTVAYIGMAIGCISVLWRNTKYKPLIISGIIAFSLLVTIIGPQKFIKETIFYDKQSISLEETSGRNHVMEVAIETIKENPMGLGFFAGEPYVLYSRGLAGITAHNSLFSAGIGLGYIGIIIMAVFLFSMGCVVFSKYIPTKHKASLIGCFFVGFLHCMGNPALGSRVYGAWLPVTLLFTLICSFYVYGKYYKKQ